MTDDYNRHEALVLTYFLRNAVDVQLVGNTAISGKGRWLMLARRAQESLHALYQAIGEEHNGVEGPR